MYRYFPKVNSAANIFSVCIKTHYGIITIIWLWSKVCFICSIVVTILKKYNTNNTVKILFCANYFNLFAIFNDLQSIDHEQDSILHSQAFLNNATWQIVSLNLRTLFLFFLLCSYPCDANREIKWERSALCLCVSVTTLMNII